VNAVTVLVQGSYEWIIVVAEAREQESELEQEVGLWRIDVWLEDLIYV
jgi:hypothetical protein